MFRDTKAASVLIAPALVFLLVFKLWPIVVSFSESFTFTSITGTKIFVGLQNYIYLIKDDPVFWGSVKVTFLYSLLVNPLMVIVALIMALLLNSASKRIIFFRTLYFLPSAISYAVVAVIWGIIFDPYYGLANSFFRLLNISPQPFLTSPGQALWCIIFLALWRNAGYWMIFFLAGLQTIPKDIYEAVDIDGATEFQRTFKITIPLLKRTMSFVLISNTAFNFLIFAPVYILTMGGPRGATNLLVFESYKSAFVSLNTGRAAAISSILLLIILIFSLIELRVTRANFEYY